MVFFEPSRGSPMARIMAFAASDWAAEVIEDLPCRRVEEQRIDSEVAAAGIANGFVS
jgi:hypothetical protein